MRKTDRRTVRRHLPLAEIALLEVLRATGYHTWHVGQWHLGGPQTYPETWGFRCNVGACEWGMRLSTMFLGG